MVVLLNAQKEMYPEPHLFCRSRSNTSSRLQRATLTPKHAPFLNCRWGTFLVTCPVVADPTSFELTDVQHVSENVAQRDLYERQMADILSPSNATLVGDTFEAFVGQHAQDEYDALPSTIRYYPLIQQCYSRSFYFRKEAPETCTSGPWKCQIPPLKNTKCAVAHRRFQRQSIRQGIQIHFSTLPDEFAVENDGCTL